jgi:hypothetical protein
MIEVDWNSLFSSFFSMVRVKIVCKDSTKIPSKGLFVMQKKLYSIQFKVEVAMAAGEGGDEGHDNNDDPTADDDNGMEELDHSELDPKTIHPKEKKQNDSSSQGHFASGNGGSSKRVATWARLFQDEENMSDREFRDWRVLLH